jgi:hypothetical protein
VTIDRLTAIRMQAAAKARGVTISAEDEYDPLGWLEKNGYDPNKRRSWQPVDLEPVLTGTYQPPTPTVGSRDDGVGLFYPGRVHSISSESEAGKTWLALYAALIELGRGNFVVYLDFEDDENGVVGRLMALGATPQEIRDRFVYIKPEDSIEALGNREDLTEVLGDTKPSLCVLDGVTEAMTLHGLEMKDNTDVARFGKLLPRWIADYGPASVALDHVTKDKETRGRYAIGGAHKLNGINGAAYMLQNRQPFGAEVTGRSGVYIAKDRPAQLRRHALPAAEGLHWFADLVVKSHDITFAEPSLYPPKPKTDGGGNRPTHVMAKVSRILTENKTGLSKNAIENLAKGNASVVRTAIELLVAEGSVAVEKRGAAYIHTLVKPFHDPEDGSE